MGKRKDCWNEGEEAQGFKEFPCKDDDQGRCACDLEELAEISLAFAREVAGHPEAVYEPLELSNTLALVCRPRYGLPLPDYANDLTAVDKVIQAAGLEWEKSHSSWLPAIGAKKIRVETFSVRKIPKEKEPSGFWYAVDQEPDWTPYHALCLAAIKCVRRVRDEHRTQAQMDSGD